MKKSGSDKMRIISTIFCIVIVMDVLLFGLYITLRVCRQDSNQESVTEEAETENEQVIEKNPFIEITEVPDDWSHFKYSRSAKYVYDVDTHVVYLEVATTNSREHIRLESEEFEGYVYDEDSNTFIGFNR